MRHLVHVGRTATVACTLGKPTSLSLEPYDVFQKLRIEVRLDMAGKAVDVVIMQRGACT
jgi:hypothetical protein